MLVQFAVENFACFADEVLFSMVASAATEHPGHIVQSEAGRRPRILRVAALYGPNAHGKSRLIEALHFAQLFVVAGTRRGAPIPRVPFRLDTDRLHQPSRFDFLIDYQGSEYSYGFAVDGERVQEEWLFVRTTAKEVRYFERVTDFEGKVRVETGPALTGRTNKQKDFLELVALGTRPNQLFLTEAADRNVEKLTPLYDWFKSVLTIVKAESVPQPLAVRASREQDFVAFLANFLQQAGTGIKDVVAEEVPLDFDQQLPGASATVRTEIEADVQEGAIVGLLGPKGESLTFYRNDQGQPMTARLKTVHEGRDGGQVRFDFEDESSGTRRLMEILPILADVGTRERVYVVDELDRKLHPHLSRFFVSSFLDRCGQDQRSQLVFTTHDTHLMDLDLLRRDEIWFFEKNAFGASTLYSMNALNVRRDLKLEKSYLQGRFGGIPLIRDSEITAAEPCWGSES